MRQAAEDRPPGKELPEIIGKLDDSLLVKEWLDRMCCFRNFDLILPENTEFKGFPTSVEGRESLKPQDYCLTQRIGGDRVKNTRENQRYVEAKEMGPKML
ncbi:hypothetical protein WN51_06687 [Melipona quadrifasciata]|uniref:Uncharacterized protein n=1 Tax=Melipona quadrifasciata TaxID=166423 RepID=A0A0N0BKE8_9HYME|nr:hypothetical protein WN51_06687 [Melipona quadrifasciata]